MARAATSLAIPFICNSRATLKQPWSCDGGQKRTPAEAFGEVLRELREERNLTQEALALEAGTERSHISALERAEKGPSLATILRLARALNVSAGALVEKVERRLTEKKR
jgi:DNA-binding XRE family transcriptional regulator